MANCMHIDVMHIMGFKILHNRCSKGFKACNRNMVAILWGQAAGKDMTAAMLVSWSSCKSGKYSVA